MSFGLAMPILIGSPHLGAWFSHRKMAATGGFTFKTLEPAQLSAPADRTEPFTCRDTTNTPCDVFVTV